MALFGLPLAAHGQTVSASNPIYGDGPSAQAWADRTPAQNAARLRKTDPYAITGYDDGVFSLKPSLEIGALASDNANFTSTGRAAGVGYVLKPSLSFATAWPVHQWTGSVSGSWTSFPTNTSYDGLAGTAQTDFRLDVRRDLAVNLGFMATVNEAMPGMQQVPGNAIGVRRDWTFGANSAVTKDFGPLQTSAKLNLLRASYGDVPLAGGTIIDNSAMNYLEPGLSLRGSLGSTRLPAKPYMEVSYQPRFHDASGTARNSQGASVALGLTLSDGPIWQGDIAAIGMGRFYADHSLGNAFNAGVNANVTWSPTRLWSVTATSGASLNESSIAGVAALPSWVLGLNATYAVRENLYLRSGIGTSLIGNGTGFDNTITASIGADYMFTPHVGLSGTVQSTWINSSTSTSRDEQRATIGILLKP